MNYFTILNLKQGSTFLPLLIILSIYSLVITSLFIFEEIDFIKNKSYSLPEINILSEFPEDNLEDCQKQRLILMEGIEELRDGN